MRHRVRWFLSLLVASGLFATSLSESNGSDESQPSAHPPDPEGTLLRSKVVAAVRDNYRRIPAGHCKMVFTAVNPGIKEKKTVRHRTPNGLTITYVETPRSTMEMDVIFSGRNVRVDRTIEENEHSSSAMLDDIWTDYNPSNKWAARWTREQMGGAGNFDPRNVGAAEQKNFFLEELAGDRVVRHETLKGPQGDRLALDMEHSIAGRTLSYRCEFDPRRNYLPARIIRYVPASGKIISVLEIDYQEVIKKSAWILKKSTQRFYAKTQATKPDQEGWTQQVTLEVGPVRIAEKIPDKAFEIVIAPGIQFRDNIRLNARAARKVDETWEPRDTKAIAESPTIQRILAAWKARQERLNSFHFTWDAQFRLPPNARFANRVNAKEIHLEIPASEFWGEGEDRFRAEFRKLDIRRPRVELGARCRATRNGDADATLDFSATLGGSPRGTRWNDHSDHESRASLLRPLLLACRPATREATGAHPDAFHVVTENAIIDKLHCIKIEKNGKADSRILETCWVDPNRDDVIVRWEVGSRASTLLWATIEYQQDKQHGWLPARWETNLWSVATEPNDGLISAKVTKYTINERFPPETFAVGFPDDTIIAEPGPRPPKK
jgi:hypothetical protein